MLDILASFAQNEFKTMIQIVASIIITGFIYYTYMQIFGDPMQPRFNEKTIRQLIKRFGRKSTQNYLQQYGKKISDYIK